MADYCSNLDAAGTAELLAGARRVIVTTHAKPDGDAFGAVVALAATLRRRGTEVSAFFAGPIPANFGQLAGYELTRPYDPDADWPVADLVVVVDTGAWSQLEPMRVRLEPQLDRVLIVDHHVSGDVSAAWRYIDPTAAATCEMLGTVLKQLGGEPVQDGFEPIVAEALFVGLASDTGWFRFSNTRPATLDLSARLLEAGVDHAGLYGKLEQSERVQKLKLMVRALDGLRLIANDRAAVMVLRADDFAETGALLEETERFVDIPQVVKTVQVVALVTQPPPQARGSTTGGDGAAAIRLSFRSKPGTNAVDVAALAQQFGGGGHQRAAGAKVIGPLDEVIARVSAALTDVLTQTAQSS